MLKNILSPSQCADCRLCCIFDRHELGEIPVISDEMKNSLTELYPQLEFVSYGKSWLFRMKESSDGMYYCPMLSDNGCTLRDSKPFDCRIWPYCIMQLGENIVITISPLCSAMYSLPLNRLVEELDMGLANVIFEEAKNNPNLIREYQEGYPVLKVMCNHNNKSGCLTSC